jgi:hypothetical protein
MLYLFVVLVWGSATSRPYADICAVILRIPRIISFANEDYPAPSYCGTPADFFINKIVLVQLSLLFTALQAAPSWVLLNNICNFCVVSPGQMLSHCLPGKTHVRAVVSKWLNVVQCCLRN